jgi:aminoglycoside phosphotransferase family enzyme
MSWVFLTDRHAYKLKKPVRHAFLDFSTLEARKAHCEEELRLNRRLAPEVYLDVVALTADASGRLALAGDGAPVEWLVKMRRLPRDRMLDAALARRDVRDEHIAALAEVLSAFYGASRRPAVARRIPRPPRADIEACRRSSATPRTSSRTDRSPGRRTRCGLRRTRSDLLEARLQAGRIVEGHGDLRPEHVCLLARPVVIDCLEFNREFRVLDVADELAYLAMECARLGAPVTGEKIFTACCERMGDRVPPRLFRFYCGYRALVRAKIAAWHSKDVPAAEIESGARRRRYLALAQSTLKPRLAAGREQFDERSAFVSRRIASATIWATSSTTSLSQRARGRGGIGGTEFVHDLPQRRVAERLRCVAHEQPVRGGRVDRGRALRAACLRGAQQRAASADQIVDDDRDLVAHVADERLAAHHAERPMFLDERVADRLAERRAQGPAQRLRALGPAGVGRDDDHLVAAERRGEVTPEQRPRLEMLGRAAEGVLERNGVVHVERHDPVDADRLERRGDVARRHRVARLRPAVLARVAGGNDRGDALAPASLRQPMKNSSRQSFWSTPACGSP